MFYHFLNQLFEVTIELDGNIDRLSTYTMHIEFLMWGKYYVNIIQPKGGGKNKRLMTK